jgi:hypothetical protein
MNTETERKIRWVFRLTAQRRSGFNIMKVVDLNADDVSAYHWVAPMEDDGNYFGTTPFIVLESDLYNTKDEALDVAEKFFKESLEFIESYKSIYTRNNNNFFYQDGDVKYIRRKTNE